MGIHRKVANTWISIREMNHNRQYREVKLNEDMFGLSRVQQEKQTKITAKILRWLRNKK
jgi:phage antirepressor YoqD-like protein